MVIISSFVCAVQLFMPFKSLMLRLCWCKPCTDSCYDYDDQLKSARSRTKDVIDVEGMKHIFNCSPHRYPLASFPSLSADSSDTPLQSPMFEVPTEIENVPNESTMNELAISNLVNPDNEGKKVNPMIPMKSYHSDDQMYCAQQILNCVQHGHYPEHV